MDLIALVIADERRVASAAPADIDRAKRIRLVGAKNAVVQSVRQREHPGTGIGVQPPPSLDRQLRPDIVGADRAQEIPLVSQSRPGKVVFIAYQHQKTAAPRL